jgi:hypothetical protein
VVIVEAHPRPHHAPKKPASHGPRPKKHHGSTTPAPTPAPTPTPTPTSPAVPGPTLPP